MTINKSLIKKDSIGDEEIGYPIRHKVGYPHRVHRSLKNRKNILAIRKGKKFGKSIKLLRLKGKI